MRKAVKTKAAILLFAWLLIFAHAVIPHNHFEDNTTGCRELIHHEKAGTHDQDRTIKFRNSASDVGVCHVSSLLYHQFHEDNFLICPAKNSAVCINVRTEHYPPVSDQAATCCFFGDSVPFRAPPAA